MANDRHEVPPCDIISGLPLSFSWGEPTESCTQTSIAILVHFLGSIEKALEYHLLFKINVLSRLDSSEGWELSGDDITDALDISSSYLLPHQVNAQPRVA